ncbi:MAG: hypothetical protein COA78_14585 [Blastopirellula sp.]|nr:MAG: hypothetical protein COA78_14585 [Blastopirellula sp.]
MNSLDTILVIVDPTVLHDHVIDKAKLFAHRANAKVELLINCSVIGRESSYYTVDIDTANNESPKKGSAELQEFLISELESEFSSLEIPVNIELCHEENLPQSILEKIGRSTPNLVLKGTHRHSILRQTLITNTDWQLIRTCSVPLLLTKPHGWHKGGHVVAAVDPMHSSSEQGSLDDQLISAAEYITKILGHPLSVFHAYYYPEFGNQTSGQNSTQSRDMRMSHNRKMYELLSRHNVDPEFVNIANGDTKTEMMHYLEKAGANILVVGALARSKLERIVVGSTAEKMLDDIPCDLLILKSNGD